MWASAGFEPARLAQLALSCKLSSDKYVDITNN